jgi:hypothetical protein
LFYFLNFSTCAKTDFQGLKIAVFLAKTHQNKVKNWNFAIIKDVAFNAENFVSKTTLQSLKSIQKQLRRIYTKKQNQTLHQKPTKNFCIPIGNTQTRAL